MASNMFTSETRETYFEPCLRLVCVRSTFLFRWCLHQLRTERALLLLDCVHRKHNFSNAQTIGRVLIRIFPVRRWIARICKRHAFGSKVPVKIRKHSITAGLKVQRTFPASLLASVRLLMLRLLPILDSARLQISTTEAITHPIAVQGVSAADFFYIPGNRSDRHISDLQIGAAINTIVSFSGRQASNNSLCSYHHFCSDVLRLRLQLIQCVVIKSDVQPHGYSSRVLVSPLSSPVAVSAGFEVYEFHIHSCNKGRSPCLIREAYTPSSLRLSAIFSRSVSALALWCGFSLKSNSYSSRSLSSSPSSDTSLMILVLVAAIDTFPATLLLPVWLHR